MESKVMRLADIKPAEYNPRVRLTEVDHEYKALKASIDEFGLVVPLIVNERTGTLVSGHQRLNVMLAEGVEETEVVIVDMEPEREKALCIALNKISGQWDYGALADILEELRDSPVDILATGFSDDEIADLLGELQEEIGGRETPDVESVGKKEDTKEGPLVQEPITTWSIAISSVISSMVFVFSGRWGNAMVGRSVLRSMVYSSSYTASASAS